MIAVVSRLFAVGMTHFFSFSALWHFNPLNASRKLEFSKTIQLLQLVVVVVVCNVVFMCNAVFKLVCSLGSSDLYDWTYWSDVGQVFLLLCLCVVFLQYLEFGFYLVLSDCAGAVGPVLPVWEPLRLVLLVINMIFISSMLFLCEFCVLPKF